MYVERLICVAVFGLCALITVEGGLSPEQMEKAALTVRNSCVDKVGADIGLVAGIRKGEFPDDHNLQCYTHCVMKKLRTFKNGGIDVDMMLMQIDAMMPAAIADRVKASTKKCGAQVVAGQDPCLMCYNFVKCNYEDDPEVFFFP